MYLTIFLLSILNVLAGVPIDMNTLVDEAGSPIDNGRNSLTVGVEGPTLLADQYLIERLAMQNRERIPERTVHARGATVKGYFVLIADVSNLTQAALFNGIGKRTPVALRFSTVIHSKGSPEFLRDPRGFAIKFYTEEGNYDIVGLNFPVFFIRDAIRFPEMIRSLKPNPVTAVQEWWRIWDWFSFYPESCHMFTWLLDDVGIPASYREMDGHGVHTYKWINNRNQQYYIKYYFQSNQGVKSLLDEDAVKQPFSFATSDLYENIQEGNYPSWNVFYQILPVQPSYPQFPFDPLDTTKDWPAASIPYRPLGTLLLNDWVDDDFLENEQIAFSPGRFVPGISAAPDKMLQGRIFSYADSQRYRIGTNYQLLPINSPAIDHLDQHQNGQMNFLTKNNPVNYFPSSYNEVEESDAYGHDILPLQGVPSRQNIPLTDDYGQAGDRWRSFDSARQLRFATRVATTLSTPGVTPQLKQTWIGYWTQVDPNLGRMISGLVTSMINNTDTTLLQQRKHILSTTTGSHHGL